MTEVVDKTGDCILVAVCEEYFNAEVSPSPFGRGREARARQGEAVRREARARQGEAVRMGEGLNIRAH
jgi:hypothetical protein